MHTDSPPANLRIHNVSGAAAALGISRDALRLWMKEPGFPKPRRIRGRSYFREVDLLAWLEKAPAGGEDDAA